MYTTAFRSFTTALSCYFPKVVVVTFIASTHIGFPEKFNKTMEINNFHIKQYFQYFHLLSALLSDMYKEKKYNFTI